MGKGRRSGIVIIFYYICTISRHITNIYSKLIQWFKTLIQNVKNYEDRHHIQRIFWCRTWIENKWSSRDNTWWKEGLFCPRGAADRMECYQYEGGCASAVSFQISPTHAHGLAVRVLQPAYELKLDSYASHLCYWTSTISWMSKNWTRLWSYVDYIRINRGCRTRWE